MLLGRIEGALILKGTVLLSRIGRSMNHQEPSPHPSASRTLEAINYQLLEQQQHPLRLILNNNKPFRQCAQYLYNLGIRFHISHTVGVVSKWVGHFFLYTWYIFFLCVYRYFIPMCVLDYCVIFFVT